MTHRPSRHPALVLALKIASISIGAAFILLGVVMIFTPGPGWLAIFAGLAMLSPHSRLAKAILLWLKKKLHIRHHEPATGDQAESVAAPGRADRGDRRARL